MATSKSEAYATKCDADGIEALSKKLTADLRVHIRSLGAHPIGSDAWMSMADSLGRIGNITEMEQKLPKDSEDATLWECEELALRYLLEDGKLNLCLRNLVEYKDYEREARRSGRAISPEMREKMDKFEIGIALMMNNAWKHVEALQTTDLPLMIEHITKVVQEIVEFPEDIKGVDIAKKQEVMVFHFLLQLCRHIDDVDEGRVMPIILEKRLFALCCDFLKHHWQQLSLEDLTVASEALAILCDTEDFQTHSDKYVATDDDRNALSAIKESFLGDIVADEMEVRRTMRPLLDVIDQAKRRMGK